MPKDRRKGVGDGGREEKRRKESSRETSKECFKADQPHLNDFDRAHRSLPTAIFTTLGRPSGREKLGRFRRRCGGTKEIAFRFRRHALSRPLLPLSFCPSKDTRKETLSTSFKSPISASLAIPIQGHERFSRLATRLFSLFFSFQPSPFQLDTSYLDLYLLSTLEPTLVAFSFLVYTLPLWVRFHTTRLRFSFCFFHSYLSLSLS